MRKAVVFLLLLMVALSMAQSDLSNIVKRINELNDLYSSFNLNSLKISILDAINNSKEKDVIATYLDFVNNSPMWIVVTTRNQISIDPYTGKIFSSQQITYQTPAYTVPLKDAISLAFVSIGKGIFFAFQYDENTWLIGSKEQVAYVSTKTPAVISTQRREGQLKMSGGSGGDKKK